MKLGRSQDEGLRCLDHCCWDDSERGGDGWISIATFAEAFGVGHAHSSALLKGLAKRGLAEVRRPADRRRREYAVSEAGGHYLLAEEADRG